MTTVLGPHLAREDTQIQSVIISDAKYTKWTYIRTRSIYRFYTCCILCIWNQKNAPRGNGPQGPRMFNACAISPLPQWSCLRPISNTMWRLLLRYTTRLLGYLWLNGPLALRAEMANRTNSNLHCSASHLWLREIEECTVILSSVSKRTRLWPFCAFNRSYRLCRNFSPTFIAKSGILLSTSVMQCAFKTCRYE